MDQDRRRMGCLRMENGTGNKNLSPDFQDERTASLYSFLGAEGIIRLQTSITESADVGDFGIPAVLPSSHPTVERLVLSTPVKSCHVGLQGLLSLLREFWILKGRKSIRAILSKCVMYRRHEAKRITARQPALPEPRVRNAAVFETTGVDMVVHSFSEMVARCGYICTPARYTELFIWN
ncbi:hypothetical protein Cfor_07899 [Coptotermes formosanus]|uniref:Uncharacterized protein n=1 Tax=Coptotermes formosanus TaxID=36987 RepID=A0A6L2PDW3_COPFO|nr:hypothetical protein Cfor_07899 [Coptotermes formosanus]